MTDIDLWAAIESLLVDFPDSKLLVGFSGGLDSTVLLHTLLQLVPSSRVLAVHINHQLQEQADQWQQHCLQLAQQWSVTCHTICLDPPPANTNIEAWARERRYHHFSKMLTPGDCVLTAHHQQDQAETLLLRLMRQAGVQGLAAMSPCRALGVGWLLRPLLPCSKAQITAYAVRHNLSWVEDPANQDISFDRSFIRQQVLPLLEQRWPAASASIAASAEYCAHAAQVATSWADEHLTKLQPTPCQLDLSLLRLYPKSKQQLLVKRFLAKQQAPSLSAKHLAAIIFEVNSTRTDANPIIALGSGEIRRYRQVIYWRPKADSGTLPAYSYQWQGQEPLVVPGRSQPLTVQQLQQLGVVTASLDWSQVVVASRRGGERCRPIGWRHNASLKQCFQAFAIPPWERANKPLVYCGNTIVAVVDGWACQLDSKQDTDTI